MVNEFKGLGGYDKMSQYATFEHYNGKPEEEVKHDPYKPLEFQSLQHKKKILSEYDTVVVLLYATWCGPCKAFKPNFQEYCKNNLSRCYFAQEDFDLGLTPKEIIRGVPSIVIYKRSQVQHIITGGKLDELEKWFNEPMTQSNQSQGQQFQAQTQTQTQSQGHQFQAQTQTQYNQPSQKPYQLPYQQPQQPYYQHPQ
jgi:thiol-disulfide isomerase/thioredoxin